MPRLATEGKKVGEARREVEEEASQAQSDKAKPKKRRRGKRRGGKGTGRRKGVEEARAMRGGHAANRTVCPGWQQASWWRVDKVGTVRTYGGPGGGGWPQVQKQGEERYLYRKTCFYQDPWPSL